MKELMNIRNEKMTRDKMTRIVLQTTARVISGLMALLLVFVGISFPAHAEDSSSGEVPKTITDKTFGTVDNGYILETSTGMQDGSIIGYIVINYTDVNNNKCNHFIFPSRDSLEIGNRMAYGIGNESKLLDSIKNHLGYEPKTDMITKAALQPYNTDQFLFQVPTAIKKIDDVRVYASTAGTWTLLGMRVFSVEKIYGVQMAGIYSNTSYIDFKGMMIAEVGVEEGGITSAREDEFSVGPIFTTFDIATANHDTQDTNVFGFRVDFADYYKDGMESQINDYADNKAGVLDMGLCENMVYNVTYEDIYGQSRIVHLPAITSTAYWLSQRISNTPTLGFGQQGGSMGFTCELPDCKKITAVTITCGSKALEEARIDEISLSGSKGSRRSARKEKCKDDTMKSTCFAVYDMRESYFRVEAEGALLKYNYIGSPVLYKLAGSEHGDSISNEGLTQIMLRNDYDGRALEYKAGDIEGYLVQLTTDDIKGASTNGNVSIKFRYQTMSGLKKETEEYSLISATNSYYGYWPGNVENFPYRYGFSQGETINFIIHVDSVDRFTGAVISLNGETNDDFQFSSFKVYNISNSGYKVANWEELNKNGVASRVRIRRVVDQSSMINGEVKVETVDLDKSKDAMNILNIDDPTLILPGDKRQIDFVSNSVGDLEDTSFNPNTVRMSYFDAMKDYDFAKARKSYKLEIKVSKDVFSSSGDSVVVVGDGDSGSKNNFYFQLQFENGASAFVQANQQLNGDYFRSNSKQEITINTNHDYGDLLLLRIIPDESTNVTDEQKADKLQLDYVQVTEGGLDGSHKAWVFDNIGWISTHYAEKMEDFSITSKSGRSLTELAKEYNVSYTANVIQVEVSIMTGLGNKEVGRNPSTGAMERIYADQLVGTVKAKINYLDNQGQNKTTAEFDVVKAMFEYMGKKSDAGVAKSDPLLMFREGHTDRFFYTMTNVKQVLGMELYVEADNGYRWNISGISGRIVREKGRLRLNTSEEYQYEFPNATEEDIIFTQSSTTSPAYSFDVNSVGQTLKFTVDGSEITENTLGETIVNYVRVPESTNDTLDVYVFPTRGTDSISRYDLSCTAYFKTAITESYSEVDKMAKFNEKEDDTLSRPMFMAIGMRASKMVDLSHVDFRANAQYANMCNLDFAIVQRVRAGTVVETYFIDLKGNDSFYGVPGYPTNDRSVLGYTEEQVITLEFGPGTENKGLVPERTDVGFALEYTNSFDPTGKVHRSPITYLTDQQIDNIKEGKTVDLKFDQIFVGDISGLQVIGTGDVKAVIKSACVRTYRTEKSGSPRLMGWYSFANAIQLSNALVPMTRTSVEQGDDGVTVPVTVNFKTSEASASYESGTRGPVKATVAYVDRTGTVLSYEIPDLRKYLPDGENNFITGKTQSVRFMLNGALAIRRIILEPKSETFDGTAGWSIDSASLQFGDSDLIMRNVGKRFHENEQESIVFSNITVGATIHNFNVQKNAMDEQHVLNNTLNIICSPGQSVYITPNIAGSEYGYDIKAYEVTGDDFLSGELVNSLVQEGNRFKFTPDANTTSNVKYYRVVIKAKEFEEAKCVINISISGANQYDIASQAVDEYSKRQSEQQKKDSEEQQKQQNHANFENAKQQAISGYQQQISVVTPQQQELYKKIIDELQKLTYDDALSYADNMKRITATVNKYIDDTEKAARIAEFEQYKQESKDEVSTWEIGTYTSAGCQTLRNQAIADIDACKDYVTDTAKIGEILVNIKRELPVRQCKDESKEEVNNLNKGNPSAEKLRSDYCAKIEAVDKQGSVDEIKSILEAFKTELNALPALIAAGEESANSLVQSAITAGADADKAKALGDSAIEEIRKASYKEEINGIIAKLQNDLIDITPKND